jgi:hypothetical protein
MDIFKNIINKKQDDSIYTGTVSTITPSITVKFYTSDTAISVKTTTHLVGLKVGSNVIMVKIQNQFVIIGVIGAI